MTSKEKKRNLFNFKNIGKQIKGIASHILRFFISTGIRVRDNWLIVVVLILFVANCLLILLLKSSTVKELLISIVSIFLGMTGISIVDFRKRVKERIRIREIQLEIIARFNGYFEGNDILKLKRIPSKIEVESEILRYSVRGCFEEQVNEQLINSIILCYFCKKWDETKSPEDFQQIQKQSHNLGLKYGEITLDIHNFLEYYHKLVMMEEIKMNDRDILDAFVERHYKDLKFFEIKEELYQSKNLHETLVRIIQVGRLSTYGINRDTLERLRHDISSSNFKQNTYLVLANKIPDSLKMYLTSLPGLSGFAPSVRNVNDIKGKFSGYIVRPSDANSPEEFLDILKRKIGRSRESYIIRIITLDFMNSLVYTIPEDQSFTTAGLQTCYNAIEWFRTGYIMDDTVLWNEIAKSTIRPDELLSLIPFNIFCRGIIPTEQSFLIQHYNDIKDYFNIEGLGEWRNVDPDLLTARILSYGEPDYSEDEEKHILNLEENVERVDAVQSRILELSTSIIEGSDSFHNSMQYQI